MKTNQTQKNIPSDWQQVKLADICSLIKDGSHGTHKDVLEGIPLLSAKDIKDGYVEIENNPRIISVDDFNQIHKNYKICNGDILLSLVGSIGKTAIVQNYNNSYTLQRSVGILRVKNESNHFLYQLFNTDYFQNELTKKENKGAQGGVYLGSLSKIKLPLPPLPEQNRIVSVLETWDKSVEKLAKKIELKKQIKKGLMQDLLTGRKRLRGFSDKWDTVELGDVSDFINGYTFKSSSYCDDGKYKIITIANVQDGFMFIDGSKTIKELPTNITEDQKLSKGDILVSMTGNVGRVCLVDNDNCLLNQRVGKIKPRNINKDLLYLLLLDRRFLNKMIDSAQGGAQANLSTGDIKEYIVDIPKSKEEQSAIAQILTTADKEINKLENKLKILKEQKRYLLNNLITGTIRTPETLSAKLTK